MSHEQQKAPKLWTATGLCKLCEISMKQNPILSQTTSRLYQHPTVEEQRPSRFATIKANAFDFLKFIALSIFLWVVISSAITWMFGG